jgi:hypothetical protein
MADETLMTDGPDSQTADTSQPPTDTQQAAVQSTEAPPADTQQAEGSDTQSEQVQPQGAPDKYEFKAADGVKYDDQVIGAFSEVAKDLNLPQEAAQKVLDKMAPVIAARQSEQLQAARNEWAESAKADKEYGGEKLPENLSHAKRALEQFGTPELRTLLNESGLGNHPEVIRFMYRAGKSMSQDGIVAGKSTSAKSAADILYDNSQK